MSVLWLGRQVQYETTLFDLIFAQDTIFHCNRDNRADWCLKNGVQYGKTRVLLDINFTDDLLPNRITLLIIELASW